MAGCGYVCPICEGRGFLDDGKACDLCSPATDRSKVSEDNGLEKDESNHRVRAISNFLLRMFNSQT